MATFILGAAVGMAIGYFINSDKKEEFLSTIKEKAGKIREGIEDQLEKGKEMLDELASKGKAKANKAEKSLDGQ
ncbi:MAG TPA: YtxH domain-containing protein [Chitinophagaceae bacterium]|nr:YtxH domain-containing protein [Chitinophagaceae bacterium]